MKHLKQYKKLYMSYAKTAIIAVMFLLVAIPFVKKVAADGNTYTPNTRYMVVLNGEELGYVSDASIAENALLDVRTQLGNNSEGLVLVETDLEFNKESTGGAVMTQSQLKDSMYETLAGDVVTTDKKETAYTVRIDDFTVTLATMEEVSELLEKVKDKYSDSKGFTVELNRHELHGYVAYTTNFVSADKTVNDAAQVLSSQNGTSNLKDLTKDDIVFTEGVISVEFVENIEIIETKQSKADVLTVEEAYELITKEHMEKDTYTVVSGDCLSSIVRNHNISMEELFAMNYGLSLDTPIYPGDVLVVTVPASEISVQIIEEKSYEETYNAPVKYVDNNSLYEGIENVISNGTAGERSVVALVTYVNGVETGREIISQTIIKESSPKVIERGTLTPPTFLKPVNSNMVTSPWGYRELPKPGFHTGVDWYVPTGTAVKATSSGVVSYSGWWGNYGYCVEITHNDGNKSRYAHLSSIPVAYGQTVRQGQVIGYSGSTGYSTGPHLLFEIYIKGVNVNPLLYVK